MSTLEVKAIQAPTGYDLQMPAGHIVQVVQTTDSTNYSTTSTSYTQGPQSASITLKNSSNKVFVMFNFLAYAQWGGTYNGIRTAIYRGTIASGSKITSGSEPQLLTWNNEVWAWQTLSYLDTPNGNTTYSLGFNQHGSANIAKIQGSYGQTVITLMEVSA